MNAPHDFSAVVRDIRDQRFDEAYDRCVAQLLAADERREQANLLIRRAAAARQRQYAEQPIPITGFGPFAEEPEPTAHERAEQEYQDRLELQDKEDRHFGSDY